MRKWNDPKQGALGRLWNRAYNWKTNLHTHIHTDTQTHTHTGTQAQTDTQTHRHTNTQAHRHTHTDTHTPPPYLDPSWCCRAQALHAWCTTALQSTAHTRAGRTGSCPQGAAGQSAHAGCAMKQATKQATQPRQSPIRAGANARV